MVLVYVYVYVYVYATTGTVLKQREKVLHGTRSSVYNGTVTIDTTESGAIYTMKDPTRTNLNGTTRARCSNVDKGTGYVLRTVTLTGLSASTAVKFTGTNDNGSATSFLVDDVALTVTVTG